MLIMFMCCVCPVLILMDCVSTVVSGLMDEVLCDVCGISVPNSVMYNVICVMYKCGISVPSPCLLSRLRGV